MIAPPRIGKRWLVARMTLAGMMVAMLATLSPVTAAEPDVRIGMYQTMFRDVSPAMVVALAKPLQGILERTMGVTGTAELVPDVETLAQKINEKKVDCGVFVGFEFAWIKAKYPELEPLIVAVPNGGTLSAVVVVNIDSKATKLEDLKDEPIAAPRGLKAHCELYFNTLRKGLPETTAKLVAKPTTSANELMNDVAAGSPGGVLIDEAAFNAFKRTNPGSGAALKIIAKSGTFPLAALVVRKGGMSDEFRRKVTEGMTNAHNVAAGKPLMMLWSLKCFETVPADYEDQLATLIKTYPAPVVKVKTPVQGELTGRVKE